LLLTAAVLGTAGLTGWVPAGAFGGTAADGGGHQAFYATSGSLGCPHDYTEGGMVDSLEGEISDLPLGLKVEGVLVDRPLRDDPDTCSDDGRVARATFTAYAGTMVVDTEVQRADNERRELSFELSASRPISRVVVQVCRISPLPGSPVRCGSLQSYPLSVRGTS